MLHTYSYKDDDFERTVESSTPIPVIVSHDEMSVSVNGFLFDFTRLKGGWNIISLRTCSKCHLFLFHCACFPCLAHERCDNLWGYYTLRNNHEEVAD